MNVLEYGYTSLNKKGEELCGDKVEIIKNQTQTTLVLADGLGSGVKANILSTLTSKILCTMIAANVSIDECIDTIISSLPVCKTRGVAYSTFSILSLDNNGEGFLVEFDNPPAVLISGGKVKDLERSQRLYRDKKIFISSVKMQLGDVLYVFSDGVLHAGVGQTLNFGWDIKEIREYAQLNYNSDYSAPCLASIMANACYELYAKMPGDDTTVLAVRYRHGCPVNLMIGPPANSGQDEQMVSDFVSGSGKKIVCGGTSSQVVARVLKKAISASFDYPDKSVPPIGYIDGIDLTCEGALTLKKLMTYAEAYVSTTRPDVKLYLGKDGASLLANLVLVDATQVNIFVGRGVNLAHEGLEISNKSKLDVVNRLVEILKKLGKTVEIKFY